MPTSPVSAVVPYLLADVGPDGGGIAALAEAAGLIYQPDAADPPG